MSVLGSGVAGISGVAQGTSEGPDLQEVGGAQALGVQERRGRVSSRRCQGLGFNFETVESPQ